MNVFYSFELDEKPNPLTDEETKIIKDFIIQRLSVLADDDDERRINTTQSRNKRLCCY